MIKLNKKVIRERHKELEQYDGFIPLYFYTYINIPDRIAFLKKSGLYESALKEMKKQRLALKKSKNKYEYRMSIVEKFIKNNPRFSDFIGE